MICHMDFEMFLRGDKDIYPILISDKTSYYDIWQIFKAVRFVFRLSCFEIWQAPRNRAAGMPVQF